MTTRRLMVHHTTTYRYAEPVAFGAHYMMFRPRASHDLRLLKTELTISPRPLSRRWVHDVFDNSVEIASFAGSATELIFDSRVWIEHLESALPDYRLDPDAAHYPFLYAEDDLATLRPALKRRHRGPLVERWVRQFIAPGRQSDTMDLLRAVTLGIKEQFDYERRLEKGVRTPAETLRRRRGSCRDFAVLMLDAARSLGLAARFVSGYIFAPGHGDAVGGGATHAWIQVYLPGAGWVDFDPTNNIIGNRNLIRVAVALDPSQALPLWGTYRGDSTAYLGMEVGVSVTEVASEEINAGSSGSSPVPLRSRR